ncbi:hypothetical protein K523DRAFT_307196 [Schizophyllum commune Tattone D]|nr:hypothetical protein K523DRAFT_307196 [Schizophyllum commune Tattone D]
MLRIPSASLIELETPIHLPHLRTLRFPSGSTCLLALDTADLSDLHVDTASAPVVDAFLQRAVHVTTLSLSQIIFQGNELRRVLASLPCLHSLSLDQCSLRFDLFFESLMVGIWPEDSFQRMQGSAYVPCLKRLRVVNCRNGTEALVELDIDLFLLMIRMRCPRKEEGAAEETQSIHRIGHLEMWLMRPSFAEECRRDWQGREEMVLVLEQPRGSSTASGIWEGF